MNEEDKIEQFSEPPKRVKISDVRVCIMELELDTEKEYGRQSYLHTFLYAYPFADEEGGIVRVFNPSCSSIDKYMRTRELPSKLLMWQSYWNIKRVALRNNPRVRILYDGIIGRDDRYYGYR